MGQLKVKLIGRANPTVLCSFLDIFWENTQQEKYLQTIPAGIPRQSNVYQLCESDVQDISKN